MSMYLGLRINKIETLVGKHQANGLEYCAVKTEDLAYLLSKYQALLHRNILAETALSKEERGRLCKQRRENKTPTSTSKRSGE